MRPRAHSSIFILASLQGRFVPAAGEISAVGEVALTEARLAGNGTQVFMSLSIVRPKMGSTSAALDVSSAESSSDCSGVTERVPASGVSSSTRTSTVSGCSSDSATVGTGFSCGGCAKALLLAATAIRLVIHHPGCLIPSLKVDDL